MEGYEGYALTDYNNWVDATGSNASFDEWFNTLGAPSASAPNTPTMPTAGESAAEPVSQEFMRSTPQLTEGTTAAGPTSLADPSLQAVNPEDAGSVAELAYDLALSDLDLPDYLIADLTADQQAAYELARQQQGVYQSYLDAGYSSTEAALAAQQAALAGTEDLASQIPGVIEPGQAAAASAAEGILSAAASSDPAVQQAYNDLIAQGNRMYGYSQDVAAGTGAAAQGALDVAAGVTSGGQGITSALESQLGAATAGAQDVVGAVDPYLYEAGELALGSAEQGISALEGTTGAYDPTMADPFMNAYVDEAVNAALEDIARQGDIMSQDVAASAVDAGAYGGSREAVAQAELDRATLDEMAATSSQMYADAYESSLAASQQAYEDQQARSQQAAALTGQLGAQGATTATQASDVYGQLGLTAEQFAAANAQALAQTGMSLLDLEASTGLSANQLAGELALQTGQFNLTGEQLLTDQIMAGAGLQTQQAQQMMDAQAQAGTLGLQGSELGLQGVQAGLGAQQQAAGIGQGIASLGQQQLGFGQAAQEMGLQDVNTLLGTGAQQQAFEQARLDAQRLTDYEQLMAPYQQLGFAADVAAGLPSGVTTTQTSPAPSPFDTMASAFGSI